MAERDPWGSLREEALALVAEALHAAYGIADDVEHLLEEPDPELADFAFPCFAVASQAQHAPPQIATEMAEALPPNQALEVEAKGPYLNFRAKPEALAEATMEAISERKGAFGEGKATGRRTLVEHTSANPTGPLHVGRARNPLLADSLVRVLRTAGHDVTAEYYVNDMGRQAATLVWGATTFPEALEDDAAKADHRLVTAYQHANQVLKEDPERDPEVAQLIQAFERGDEEVAHTFRETISQTLEGIRQTLERAHVHHDNFKFESEIVLSGEVQAVLDRLKKLDACHDEDGALYLDMPALGVEYEKERMFLTRSDGTTLYATRDVAYHMDKFARADELVDVLGEDHKLHALELSTALEAIGEDGPLDVVFYNFVSLPEGSMSTRSGRVVYLDDLLDEAEARAYEEVEQRRGSELSEEEMREVARQVGLGALRFNIVGVHSEKPITFEWEQALSFEGSTAPFVQYSHARACSILAKGGQEPGQVPLGDPTVLTHESETALLRTLSKLPSLVQACAEDHKVHPLTAYAVAVAGALNEFYRDCPVLQADSATVREARLALVDATRQVLANTLELLGIDAPASM